ncbi:snaclec 3-like [Onychostoma macrolepis]|uniref:snaclec 3-like n=1 Tax=Onychostoma macrolepis TaxID=369639 RepID=UPI00272AD9CE|nr:snaclec 3-like [Onychostoma macrolepis]
MKAIVIVFLFLSLFGLSFSLYRKHFLVKKRMTWEDAQKYCREHHDDLSTVNEEEAQQISTNPENNNGYFWIGLHMISNNQEKWTWSGGEDQKIFWDISEPNSVTEQCGCLNRYTAKLHNAMCPNYLQFYCMEVFEPILEHQNKTWDESLNYCRQNYIDLVSLSSQTYMEEVINKTLTSQTAYVWTGLHFMAGYWFWVSGDDLQYKAWSTEGEIQCPSGNLRCGALDREQKLWKPRDCEERHNFLCLKKP